MAKPKVYLVSLGCSKNTVDSERVLKLLEEKYEPTTDPSEADLLLVNTCGFITPAKEESIETILQLADVKKKGAKLVAFGCFVKRYMEELKRELHEVDILLPTEPYKEICNLFDLKVCDLKKRELLTPRSYAYLKISEGCNRTCAFCAIPKIRGKFRSKSIGELVDEAKYLIDTYGIKELVLVSQDTSYYGKDIYGKFALPRLLDELQKLPLKWIRLHYLYPAKEVYEIVDYLERSSEKVLPYVDMPIQHISDRVLKSMRRGHSAGFLKKLLSHIRERLGENSILRTTVIVGFPTEGEEEFKELLRFVEEFGFDYLGVFKYYHEEDTPAWEQFEDTVPEEVKEERKQTLEAVQSYISEERLSRFLETEQEVLVDGYEEETGLVPVGRAWFQSPEVDGQVYIEPSLEEENFKPREGDILKVFLTEQVGVDFKGKVL
ncbi:MAG TPA: 30S ribosomal protein S12 methylthiotransferase RimO [Aquifex sp.]|nr:30S ribosomal protein S12 methylthiotransferase RimO [Aquifex sp.]